MLAKLQAAAVTESFKLIKLRMVALADKPKETDVMTVAPFSLLLLIQPIAGTSIKGAITSNTLLVSPEKAAAAIDAPMVAKTPTPKAMRAEIFCSALEKLLMQINKLNRKIRVMRTKQPRKLNF